MLKGIKTIFWDFDGVLMNSNAIRDLGFQKVLAKYPDEQVELLMNYHRANGGLSRYVKFRYFFEQVLNEAVSDDQIQNLSASFSEIMRSLLVNPELLIQDSLNFVKSNYKEFPMHIVSGSDQTELRHLCIEMNIAQYFLSINGSPTPKKKLVSDLLISYKYNSTDVALIGDSVNDYEAASVNGLLFFGYNNKALERTGEGYIDSFEDLNK
ncbi:HAD family hydrolase [soil metagenome]